MSEETNETLPPCPFCGCSELTKNLWSMNGGEADAVECNKCFAGAPLIAWKKRPTPELPAEGDKFYFEDKIWCVVNYDHGMLGDLKIRLEQVNIKEEPKRFELIG